jgi:hypothetical protein
MPTFDNPWIRKMLEAARMRGRPGDAAGFDGEPDRDPGAAVEAEARKQRSIAILNREGVSMNEHLPTIGAEAEIRRRSTEDMALRALALMVVAMKGASFGQAPTREWIEAYGIGDALTPKERAFTGDPAPARDACVQLSWRYECLWVLLWALGFIDELGPPDRQADPAPAVATIDNLGRTRFVAQARLRPARELLDAADLIYRCHWAVRDAEFFGRAPPPRLDPGVVRERHYALNWLIGHGEDWDEVSTDT